MATITSLIDNSASTSPNSSNVNVYATGNTPMQVTLGSGEQVTIAGLNGGNPITTSPFNFSYSAGAFPSGISPVVTPVVVPTLAKSTVSLGTVTTTSIPASWTAVTNATSYNLRRSTSSDGSGSVSVYTGANLSFNDTGLTPNTTYYYFVVASAVGYTSSTSDIVNKATSSTPSLPQSVISFGTSTSSSNVINWTSVPNATSYLVRRSVNSDMSSPTTIYTGALLTYTDTGLASGTTYYYSVTASAVGYNSSTSAIASKATSGGSFDTLTTQENFYDSVQYAKSAYKFGTSVQVADGESSGVVVSKKGENLVYDGNTNLAITNSPPITRILSDQESYITTLNLPDQSYGTNVFDPLKGNPRDFAAVIRVLPGQSFEQFQDAFETGNGYGDNGTVNGVVDGVNQPIGFNVRIHNQNAVDGAFIPFYKKTLVQIATENSRVRLWINGVLQGQITPSFDIPKKRDQFFVGTNNPDHQLFAQYQKYGLLSDSDRSAAATSIMSKWNVGDIFPNYPMAYYVRQSLSGGTWSTQFLTRNPSGTGINLAATQYKWVINIRKTGGFENQKVIATTATITNSFLTAQLEAYRIEIGAGTGDEKFVYCMVKAIDNNGNGWEYLRGEYTEI